MRLSKVAVAMVSALVFSACMLCACSSQPSPSDVTASFLDAMKACDHETIEKTYSGADVSAVDIAALLSMAAETSEKADAADGEWSEDQMEVFDSLVAKANEFDYEILGETVDEGAAKVEVKLSAYEIGDALDDAVANYISKAFVLAFSEGSNEEKMQRVFISELDSAVRGLTEKNYVKTIELSLTKTDDGWKVDELSEKQLDAMYGGITNSLEAFK